MMSPHQATDDRSGRAGHRRWPETRARAAATDTAIGSAAQTRQPSSRPRPRRQTSARCPKPARAKDADVTIDSLEALSSSSSPPQEGLRTSTATRSRRDESGHAVGNHDGSGKRTLLQVKARITPSGSDVHHPDGATRSSRGGSSRGQSPRRQDLISDRGCGGPGVRGVALDRIPALEPPSSAPRTPEPRTPTGEQATPFLTDIALNKVPVNIEDR